MPMFYSSHVASVRALSIARSITVGGHSCPIRGTVLIGIAYNTFVSMQTGQWLLTTPVPT